MTKEYVVTVKEIHRVEYIVTAESEEEARSKIEHPERSYNIAMEEYYDLDSIESVEENK